MNIYKIQYNTFGVEYVIAIDIKDAIDKLMAGVNHNGKRYADMANENSLTITSITLIGGDITKNK